MQAAENTGDGGAAEARVRALPLWTGAPTVTPLKGGVSNTSFKVTDSTGSYVARLGGDYPFHQVSREREAIASRAAFEAGLSPELVHAGDGLMVLRYVEARTYAEADVRANAASCVDILKRCHARDGQAHHGPGGDLLGVPDPARLWPHAGAPWPPAARPRCRAG